LTAPAQEATWAVVVDGSITGSIRLKATARQGCLETGAWLGRAARGQGIGRQALAAVIEHAARAGAKEVCAETTTGNSGALAILRHLHFDIEAIGGETLPVAGRPGGRAVLARLWLST
jgi:RimJ/RimL family protein N-acetyltransferase